MKRDSHNHLKGLTFCRPGMDPEEDRWTVKDVFVETNRGEAHARLLSLDGEEVEVPVSHLKDPFWRQW